MGGECSHHCATLVPPTPSPVRPSPVLTFVLRSLGDASHASYVFAVCKKTCWKKSIAVKSKFRASITSPYFLGWLKGYGPRLGTTNGSTRSSCFVSFGSSLSCFRFLLSGDSGNVILKGNERIRHCFSAYKFRGENFQSKMLMQLSWNFTDSTPNWKVGTTASSPFTIPSKNFPLKPLHLSFDHFTAISKVYKGWFTLAMESYAESRKRAYDQMKNFIKNRSRKRRHNRGVETIRTFPFSSASKDLLKTKFVAVGSRSGGTNQSQCLFPTLCNWFSSSVSCLPLGQHLKLRSCKGNKNAVFTRSKLFALNFPDYDSHSDSAAS